MSALTDMIAGEAVPGHGGCPRVVVNEDGWRLAINQLSAGSWTLLGLWGDAGAVHMAALAEGVRELAVVTMPCPDGSFPPVGPVHAGIIEPGHFRFTANGETVVRLEERLGYVHKGIEGLMAGATLDAAARLAGRTSGDSTVAYALA